MHGGDRMTLAGLQSAPHYNGQSVTLLRASDDGMRSACCVREKEQESKREGDRKTERQTGSSEDLIIRVQACPSEPAASCDPLVLVHF